MAFGWSSPITSQITADEYGNCYYHFCVTKSEMAWIASCLSIGSLALGYIAGPIMSAVGRKLAIILYAFITLGGWIFLTYAQAGWMLLVGRFLVGAGFGGSCVISPIYTGEIADTKIRGKLLSFMPIFIQAGITTSYILGYIFRIFEQNLISLLIVSIFTVSLIFIPESPRYYVS